MAIYSEVFSACLLAFLFDPEMPEQLNQYSDELRAG
jgi:hypothetical protein